MCVCVVGGDKVYVAPRPPKVLRGLAPPPPFLRLCVKPDPTKCKKQVLYSTYTIYKIIPLCIFQGENPVRSITLKPFQIFQETWYRYKT